MPGMKLPVYSGSDGINGRIGAEKEGDLTKPSSGSLGLQLGEQIGGVKKVVGRPRMRLLQ